MTRESKHLGAEVNQSPHEKHLVCFFTLLLQPTKKKKSRTVTGVFGSVCAEDVDSVIASMNKTALLYDVLKANGEEHLYFAIRQLIVHVEDDPPVIFGWQNVEVFVQAILVAQQAAAVPGGVPLPPNPLGPSIAGPVTVHTFKEAVLEYARADNAPARLDTTCLPCSLEELCEVVFALRSLDLDPWIDSSSRLNALPIAHVYVPRPGSNTFWEELQSEARTVCGGRDLMVAPV